VNSETHKNPFATRHYATGAADRATEFTKKQTFGILDTARSTYLRFASCHISTSLKAKECKTKARTMGRVLGCVWNSRFRLQLIGPCSRQCAGQSQTITPEHRGMLSRTGIAIQHELTRDERNAAVETLCCTYFTLQRCNNCKDMWG
jgi:hypothetical protein